MTSNRAIGFWVVGAVCVFLGALIAGAVDPSVLGATMATTFIAYIISFVMILIGGMFWISVATAIHEGE